MPTPGWGTGEVPGTKFQTWLEDTGCLPIPLNLGEGHQLYFLQEEKADK